MKGFREFTLENGLRVALLETNIPIFSAQIRIPHGALSELPGEEGYAHFLEHSLMNGGSEKYTPEQVAKLHSRFASHNAHTSLDHTTYEASSLPDDFELYLDLFSDIVFNPRFAQKSVDEERRRVLREMADHKSKPDFQDWEKAKAALRGTGTPWTYQILGDEEAIVRATPEDFKKFHARLYHANNADLIMAGTLPQNAEELIRKYLERKQTGGNASFVFPQPMPLEQKVVLHTSAPDLLNKERPNESSAFLSIAFQIPSHQNHDFWPLLLANEILGGDANSKLFQTLSRRKGLAYGIRSIINGENNAGYISVQGKVKAELIDESIDLIFNEIDHMKKHGISQEELTRMRRKVAYEFASVLSNPAACIRAIEKKLDYDWTIESYLERINSITPEQVINAINKYAPSKDGKYVLLIRNPLKKD
jgi:predicted Zn-dependent peptidase